MRSKLPDKTDLYKHY